MLKNYLTVALRNVRRQKGYAAINIVGLALGMACCLLIFTLVRHEWSFDTMHEKGERIYRVLIQETRPDGDLDYRVLMPPSIAPETATMFPTIEAMSRFVVGQRDVRKEDQVFQERLAMVDSTFLDLFSFPLLAGDRATALDDPQAVVLTEPVARAYFGVADQTALGKSITVERGTERYDFTVTGVLAPLPVTSSLQFDMLMSFHQYEALPIGSNDWGGRTSLYVLLAEGQQPAALEAALVPFTATLFAERIDGRRAAGFLADGPEAFQLTLQPLLDLHHDPERSVTYETPPSNPRYAYILLGIAVMVLTIACINFITLALGRSTTRAREVGVRKSLGANRGQLMRQFWGEALLLSVLALPLGVVLAALALPTFNLMTGQDFGFAHLAHPAMLWLLAGLIAFVALVGGSYPALVLSRFQAASVLKGDLSTRGRRPFTSALVVAQYVVSIGLIVCTLVMYRQLDYLLTKDLGFDAEQVVAVAMPRLTDTQKQQLVDVVRQDVVGQQGVVAAAPTSYSFTRGYDTYGWTAADGTPFTVHNIAGGYGYLDLLGMELVAGRNFSPDFPSDSTQSVLVNEAFVETYGIAEPIGHVLTGLEDSFFAGNPTIIGVVKDFNFETLRDPVAPAMLNMHPDYYGGLNALLVRVQPDDVPTSLAHLEATWTALFPDRPFTYSFLREDLADQYQDERRWRTILTDSALLAILIACMGLFGLATLTVAKRRKEIGVRKVLGASVGSVVALLSTEFVRLVVIAFVLAAPLAYLAMHRWLEDFAYRIDIGPLSFLIAGILAIAVALVTVGAHAYRAARANPVKSLRYE